MWCVGPINSSACHSIICIGLRHRLTNIRFTNTHFYCETGINTKSHHFFDCLSKQGSLIIWKILDISHKEIVADFYRSCINLQGKIKVTMSAFPSPHL